MTDDSERQFVGAEHDEERHPHRMSGDRWLKLHREKARRLVAGTAWKTAADCRQQLRTKLMGWGIALALGLLAGIAGSVAMLEVIRVREPHAWTFLLFPLVGVALVWASGRGLWRWSRTIARMRRDPAELWHLEPWWIDGVKRTAVAGRRLELRLDTLPGRLGAPWRATASLVGGPAGDGGAVVKLGHWLHPRDGREAAPGAILFCLWEEVLELPARPPVGAGGIELPIDFGLPDAPEVFPSGQACEQPVDSVWWLEIEGTGAYQGVVLQAAVPVFAVEEGA